jgi:hypothetical protein
MRRAVVILVCGATLLTFVPTASAARPLRTAIADFSPAGSVAFQRTRSAGATMARLTLSWRGVAPRRPTAQANPRDPAYDWASFDREVMVAVGHGLRPIVTVAIAPHWAQGRGSGAAGTVRPDPVALGRFARAAATRYRGGFVTASGEVLPAVRHWQVWNEPNRGYFLSPQYVNGSLVAADRYRAMVNRFADAVHAVDRANIVVAGGLAPFGRRGHAAPLAFMRDMLCMSRRPHRPVCAARARFDAWSTHPYTSGGPTRRAFGQDDVSIGDLPEMRRLLSAAVRAGRVVSSRSVQFWVTEFAWDSDPPDRYGVPIGLHARWTAEALYRMWRSGVSVVTWFLTRDQPVRRSPYQSGLYFSDGRPKLARQAFRFPFVAFVTGRRVFVWGRTPWGLSGRVIIQQKTSRRWRTVAAASANGYGIFSRKLRIARRGFVRARLADRSATSVPFSLRKPRICYVNAFGGEPPIGLRPVC